MIIVCPVCKKEFNASRYHVEKCGIKHCSLKCRRTSSSVLIICIVCGKSKRLKRSQFNRPGRGKYCSPFCKYSSKRKKRKCMQCGIVFEKAQSNVRELDGRGKFCSLKCKREASLGTVDCPVCRRKVVRKLSRLLLGEYCCGRKCANTLAVHRRMINRGNLSISVEELEEKLKKKDRDFVVPVSWI